ncbi:hypothetical protein [Algoriphagus chordae]|uniref:Uncharacterized protein n=1 Tax=Algoriphagus chordae TaxID=237019 RepID=A0A2W7R8K3_9BACT|nr:hypothetical protein [Algoriphagus chordae]PZX56744.1 hypothetical protein LV85_00677 [Algoriphagus chordae]
MKTKLILPVALVSIGLLSYACNPAEKTEIEEKPEVVSDVILEEDFILVIDEYHLNETPIATTPPTTEAKSTPEAKASAPKTDNNTAYEPLPAIEFQEVIIEEYDLVEVPVIQTQIAIPLNETQTVMAYNKKGKAEGSIQVVSNGEGEIDHILFQDKNHKDSYDVQAGMSAKEVKKLRKEMKHMVHKGQVFYYTDDSNIMYLLDTEVPDSGEVIEAEVEESVVSAVIWKDKKHKDHPNKSKK